MNANLALKAKKVPIHATSSTSLFNSPNENKPSTHKCLMVKEAKVLSTPNPPLFPPNASTSSYVSCDEDLEEECEEEEEDDVNASLTFMKSLRAEALVRFLNLLKSLAKRNDYIERGEDLIIEEKERVMLLEQILHKERTIRASLESTIETYVVDFAKSKDIL